MDTKTRTTKQGIRDLNFYGSRKKPAEPGATDAGAATESGLPAVADAADADGDGRTATGAVTEIPTTPDAAIAGI